MSFNFGSIPTQAGSTSNASTNSVAAAAGGGGGMAKVSGFSFGSSTTSSGSTPAPFGAGSSGFHFGSSTSTATAAPFSFGASTTTTGAASSSSSTSTTTNPVTTTTSVVPPTAPSTTTGFSFGAAAATTAPTTTGFAFGATPSSLPAAASTGGFSFGATATPLPAATAAATSTGGILNFGGPSTSSSTATAPSSTTTAAATTGFNFGASTSTNTSTNTGFSFGSTTAAPDSAAAPKTIGFSFGTTATNAGETAGAASSTSTGSSIASKKPATTTPAAAAADTKPDQPATDVSSKPISIAPTQPSTTVATNLFGGSTTASAPGSFSFGTVGDSNKKVESKGGFSFGPTSVANTSTENKDQNSTTTTKEPAPATTSGLSFGITTAAAAVTPTDKPGFHLFAGKTDNGSITTTTAPPETPTTTFKLRSTAGNSTPTASTTEAGSSKATSEIGTTPAPTPTGPPPPLEYQTKTVQEIINSFSEHLEKDAIEFVKQAQRVAEWDAVLRDSQAGMEGLTEKISQLLFQQQEVDRTLNAISAYQRETESTLDVVEKQIDLILQSHTHLLPSDADREREAAYQRAIEVDARMSGLQHSLNTLVADLNAATGQVTSSQDEKENSGVGQIVQLLNNHHETLVWLENTTKSLERDLAVIGRSTNSATRIYNK